VPCGDLNQSASNRTGKVSDLARQRLALGMQDILRHSCPQTQDTYVHAEQELTELVRLVKHVHYRYPATN